jgi:hypothetical protein
VKIRENIIQSPPSALLQIIRPAPRIMHHTSDEDHQISFIALCIFDGALIVIAASQLIIYSGLL